MLVGAKAFDAVDFEIDAEGGDLAQTRNPEHPLHIVVGDQDGAEEVLELRDLRIEKIDRLILHSDPEGMGTR